MPSTIVQNAAELFVFISGRRITAFPADGDFMSIEPLADRGTFREMLDGGGQFSRNPGKGYTLTLTIGQGSEDDNFMWKCKEALSGRNALLSASVTYGVEPKALEWVSGQVDIRAEPARTWSAAGANMSVWIMHGVFPVARVGTYALPQTLTEDQINALVL